MSALDRHPDGGVEAQLRVLRAKKWKIVKSKYNTFYDITCLRGKNTRISARLMNKQEKQKFRDWLDEHDRQHPDE